MSNKKGFLKRIPKHLIIDFSFLFVFIIFFTVDLIYKPIPCSNLVPIDIIISLLPAIITVIAVTLSLMKDEVLGLKRSDLYKLRNSWAYSILGMVLIVIIIFGICSICLYLNLGLSVVIIDIISMFYAFSFSIQEIPMLTNGDEQAKKILQYSYRILIANNSTNQITEGYNTSYQDTQKKFNDAITKLVFSMGMKSTYLSLKSKKNRDIEFIDYLLDDQNKYLFSVKETLPSLKSNPNCLFKSISLLDAIESGYENLIDLFMFSNNYGLILFSNQSNATYRIVRSYFYLHKISQALCLADLESQKNHLIIDKLYVGLFFNNEKKKRVSFINTIMTNTLPNGEVWFAKELRDYESSNFLFPINYLGLGFFYMVYCYYLIKIDSKIEKVEKKIVFSFLIEPSHCLEEENMSWMNHIIDCVQITSTRVLYNSLLELLYIYDSSSEETFTTFIPNDSTTSTNAFEKSYIFDAWIEILLYCSYPSLDDETLEKVLGKISYENQKLLVSRLKYKWIDGFELKADISHPFLDFLGIEKIRDKESINPEIIKELCNFANKFSFEAYVSSEINEENDKEACQKYLDFIRQKFEGFAKSSLLLNRTIDLSNEKKLYYSVILEGPGIEKLVKVYTESCLFSLAKRIGQIITDEGNLDIHSSVYYLSKEDIDSIISFAPNYMSFNSTIDSYANDEQKTKIKYIEKCKQESLPPNLFWKKDAISINLSFDNELSYFKPLTDNEVNEYIDAKYSSINGLYKFGSLDEINSFWVTRKWLFDHLKKNLFRCLIVFKFKVFVNSKGLFIIHKSAKCDHLNNVGSQDESLLYIIKNKALICIDKMLKDDKGNNSCLIINQTKENGEFIIYYQRKYFGVSSMDDDSKNIVSPTGTYDNFRFNEDGKFKITFDTRTENTNIEKK